MTDKETALAERVKVCRDCRWCLPDSRNNGEFDQCSYPGNIGKYITVNRQHKGPQLCGFDAKWFEPKPAPTKLTDRIRAAWTPPIYN